MGTGSLKNMFKAINLGNTYEHHPDAVIVIDYYKNIISWNKQAESLFEYTPKEALKKNISLIFGKDVDKIYKSLNENKSIILSTKTKSTKELIIEATCSDAEVKNEVIIAIRNVTQSHKVVENIINEYDNLVNISKNKSSFIASLSHELRTPMHSIIGFSQALLDGLGGELTEKQKKYVSIVSKNANNLLALLNSLLDLSKIESGKMEYSYKVFDVVSLISSVAETMNPMIQEKKLELTFDFDDVVKKNVYSDENHIRQIIQNLFSNSIKFTEIGSIRIKAMHPDLDFVKEQGLTPKEDYTDKSYLMITVADTGIGIADDEQSIIFDEYRQLDRANSKKYGGTGLGLAIAKKILLELGGTIWVESELGEGSTFNLIFPIERPKESAN